MVVMAHVRTQPSVCLMLLCLFCLHIVTVSSNGEVLIVRPGETVTLPCSTSEKIKDLNKVLVKWTRNDLNNYVLQFRDGRLYSEAQDSQFTDRVNVSDPDLKNGDLSMILRNVTHSDTGMYKCTFIGESSDDEKLLTTITLKVEEVLIVRPGETVTLPCSTSEKIQDLTKKTVEWTRNDLNVLLFQNGRLDCDPKLKGRVNLSDPDLKNGNLSMILRNVRQNDKGTYECRFKRDSSRNRRAIIDGPPLRIIELKVEEDEETTGRAHLGLILVITALVVSSAVGAFFAVRKFRPRRRQDPPQGRAVDDLLKEEE